MTIARLNSAFKVLMGKPGPTTQSGMDSEYVDSSLADITTIDNSRVKKYADFVNMDDSYGQEISSSLDAVADMTLRIDEPLDNLIQVMANSASTVKFIKDLHHFLSIEEHLWTWARTLAKHGDLFVELIWYKNSQNNKLSGLAGLKVLPAKTIFLNVNKGVVDKAFPYRQEIEGNFITKFRPWQIAHFMIPREPTDDYGTSWLKSARLPFRQLVAMENALVVGRLKKPNMRVHKVDVTNKTYDQAKVVLRDYKDQFLKKLWINPSTGKLEKHQTPVLSNDDIYMGVTEKGGKNAGIDLIEGKSEIDIKDILYIREKMLAALKTPKHRMNINDVGASNKLVATDQGLYFSAAIQRVQISLIMGISFITDLALLVKGTDIKARRHDYTLALPKQRSTDELVASRVALIQSTVAKNYKEIGIISDEAIMRDVLKWDEDQIKTVKKELERQRAENPDADKDDGDNGDNGDDGKSNGKDDKFNKTGTGSAPVRKPQKEDLDTILADERVQALVANVSEIMRNKRIFGNKSFTDMSFLENELSKKQE